MKGPRQLLLGTWNHCYQLFLPLMYQNLLEVQKALMIGKVLRILETEWMKGVSRSALLLWGTALDLLLLGFQSCQQMCYNIYYYCITNRNYNKILDHDWFSAHLFVT